MRMRPDSADYVTHIRVTDRGWDCGIADRGDGSYVPEVWDGERVHQGRVCSSEAEARDQLAALVRDLEREPPVTRRVLPYPPDARQVASDLYHALAALYLLAGWDVAELCVTMLADGVHIRVDSAGYLDSTPHLYAAAECVFAIGVLADPDTLSDVGTLADLRRAETTDEGRLLVSGRIAELILDCLPEPVTVGGAR